MHRCAAARRRDFGGRRSRTRCRRLPELPWRSWKGRHPPVGAGAGRPIRALPGGTAANAGRRAGADGDPLNVMQQIAVQMSDEDIRAAAPISKRCEGTAHDACLHPAGLSFGIPWCLRGAAGDPAARVVNGDAVAGRAAIMEVSCGVCHVIPGIAGARGAVGPSLEKFAQRSFIGGVAANRPASAGALGAQCALHRRLRPACRSFRSSDERGPRHRCLSLHAALSRCRARTDNRPSIPPVAARSGSWT